MRFTPSYAMTPYTRSELHMTSDTDEEWQRKVEAHLTRDERASYRLARALLEDPLAIPAPALTFAIDAKSALTSDAVDRMRSQGGRVAA